MRARLEGVGGLPPLAVIASIIGVGAFALGQPILDLVGRNPEFFIARRFPVLDIVVLAALLMLTPLLLVAPVFGLRAIDRAAGGAAHLVVLAALGAAAVATALQAAGAGTWTPALYFGLAALVGVALAVLYARVPIARTALSFLGLAPVVFAVWFATATPVAGLLFSSRSELPEAGNVANPVPVVMVVFDEFPLASLMHSDQSLNEESFPGFARLAGDGVWYRNAVGVHQQTEEAVPAILTGREVSEGSIPSTVDHPFTLFSLLSEEYDIQAVENVTELCPGFICGNVSRPVEAPSRRWTSVTVDLAVVYGHMVLPDDMSADLPPIDQGWGGFGQAATEEFDIIDRFLDEVSEDRRRELDRFLATFDAPGAKPPLRFGHFLYPHHPWELTGDGRIHGAGRPPGRDGVGWGGDDFLVAQGWQWHLIQARFADAMLGRVLDDLEARGWYEEALVMVVADHGITIRPDTEHQRVISHETVGSVAFVPLFVKYPSSLEAAPSPGTVDDLRAETVDIVPTIGEVLGVDVPWRTDGLSLLSADRSERSHSVVHGTRGSVEVPVETDAVREVVRAQEEWFPGGDPYRLAPPGWRDLLGVEAEGGDQAGLSITLDQEEALASFRPGGDPVPAHLSGSLAMDGGATGEEILAVSVGGQVAAVTRAYVREDGGVAWEAMIPPRLVDSGEDVEVWLVRGSASNPSFVR